jgi:hypothetical protein
MPNASALEPTMKTFSSPARTTTMRPVHTIPRRKLKSFFETKT